MKKIIALMLVMLLVFSLVGCKSKGYTDDEEIAVIAGDETQVDIDEDNGVNEQEQKAEETPTETVDVTDDITESTDTVVDTSAEGAGIVTDATQSEQTADSVIENKSESKDINQLEYDNQGLNTICSPTYEPFRFDTVSDMINTLKTHEYVVSEEERKGLEERFSSHTDKQLAADRISKIGTKDDVRYDEFNVDSIKYFYMIKEIPGYTLSCIELSDKRIYYTYVPTGKEKITDEDKISVIYMRNEHFVTDSYFEDYIEYYNFRAKEKEGKILDKNDSVGGLLCGDDFLYTKYERSDFAVIEFSVENTMIRILSNSELANYEALKKLCVAEKVVVK